MKRHVLETSRDWVTIEEAMELTGRGRRTIYRWKDDGLVRFEKPRKRVYFNRDDLLATEAAAHVATSATDTR